MSRTSIKACAKARRAAQALQGASVRPRWPWPVRAASVPLPKSQLSLGQVRESPRGPLGFSQCSCLEWYQKVKNLQLPALQMAQDFLPP